MNKEPVCLAGPEPTQQHKAHNKVHSLSIPNPVKVKRQVFENQGKMVSVKMLNNGERSVYI